MKKNILLTDFKIDKFLFLDGLNSVSNQKWEIKSCKSFQHNGVGNIKRYLSYFLFPFMIFLKRKEYSAILSWQTFYGLNFAFFCKVFRVKKINKLAILHLVYKPKQGILGTLYNWYLHYVLDNSAYIDFIICPSEKNCDYLKHIFKLSGVKVLNGKIGVPDYLPEFRSIESDSDNFILSVGRSNRDYEWLINSLKNTKYKLIIISDTLSKQSYPNIEVLNTIYGDDYLRYIRKSKLVVIPTLDPNVDSGFLVLLHALSLERPVVISKPSCMADEYVLDGYNGIVINKEKQDLVDVLDRLLNDYSFYNKLVNNGRNDYLLNFSEYAYGVRVNKIIS